MTLEERRNQLTGALMRLRENPDFVVLMTDMMREANVTRPVFHTDPIQIARAEGRRHLVMSYLALISPDMERTLLTQGPATPTAYFDHA